MIDRRKMSVGRRTIFDVTGIQERIARLEEEMLRSDFWKDKEQAQKTIKEIGQLKEQLKTGGKYDKGDAVVSIYAGAGGDDAEDWASILLEMYRRYSEKKNWMVSLLHHHTNERGGTKNVTVEIQGRSAYGYLKGESGVHRLVRISPFSAKKLRHTSFALVEVMPKRVMSQDIEIKPDEVEVTFSRSSGPGGQHVNKRETAVRMTHKPTGIQVHVETERSQAQNRERALELLRSRLYQRRDVQEREEIQALRPSKGAGTAEWGRQIRSYVFHPYQMVKDHRTNVETSDVDGVLAGELDEFIKAELALKNV